MEPLFLTRWLEVDMIIRLVVSAAAGALIGYERERMDKPAGLRTHMLVSIGSCVFTLLSMYAFGNSSDPGRVAANIVVGIGFLGAGTIIHARGKISGLTTAASVWAVSAIGMAIGTGFYVLGIVASVLVFVVLHFLIKVEDIVK